MINNLQVRIAIRLPTDTTVYFVYLFPLFLPYMFRDLISPSSGVSQAVFIYNHLVHLVFMLLICVCLWTGLSWCFRCTGEVVVLLQENHHGTSTLKPPRQTSPQAHADEQHKHQMNQMVVYKNSLRYP